MKNRRTQCLPERRSACVIPVLRGMPGGTRHITV